MIFRDLILGQKTLEKGDIYVDCILIDCILDGAIVQGCKIIIDGEEVSAECDCLKPIEEIIEELEEEVSENAD